MPAFRTPVRRTFVAATAAMAVLGLAACGGGGSATAAKDNPYGLQQAGTLRVGTLTDAPPNVYLKDGKFTGFDNDLLTAVAGKLGLKVEFVGTDFSALLAQVKNKKFDVGSSSITITEARKKTVASPTATTSATSASTCPPAPTSRASTSSRASASPSCRARCRTTTPPSRGSNPVRVPDYNSALNQLKAGTADAWVAPAEIGEKTAKDSGGKVVLAAKQLSSAPTAFAVAHEQRPRCARR